MRVDDLACDMFQAIRVGGTTQCCRCYWMRGRAWQMVLATS